MEYARVLRQRDFRLLWLSLTTSLLGDHLHFIALIWLVLEMTGSGLSVSFIMLGMFLPDVLFGSFSGVLADRWEWIGAGVTLAFGPGPVLLAVLANEELRAGPEGYGLLNVAANIGLLSALLLVGQYGRQLHRGRTVLIGYISMGLATMLLGLSPTCLSP